MGEVVKQGAPGQNVEQLGGMSFNEGLGLPTGSGTGSPVFTDFPTQVRINSDTNALEMWDGAQWIDGSVVQAQIYTDNAILNFDRVKRSSALSYQNSQDEWATIISPISNPASRYTETFDGSGNVTINTLVGNSLGIGPLFNTNQVKNRIFIAEAVAVNIPNTTAGFGICINPSSDQTIDTVDHAMVVWRANGAVVVYKADAITVSPVTVTSISPSVPPYVAGDVLAMAWSFSDDSSTCAISFMKNGVIVSNATVNNLPEGFIGAIQRSAATNTSFRFTSFMIQEKSTLATGVYYVDAATSASIGDGTKLSPFKSLSTMSYFSRQDTCKNIIIKLVGGTIHRGMLELPPSRYEYVRILALNGQDVKIYGSQLVTSGWTKTGGFTNVWERPHLYNGVSGSTNIGGGAVDVTGTQEGGIVPCTRIYTRLIPATTLATLDATPFATLNQGGGKLYINANGTDPNTIPYELPTNDFCVSQSATNGTDFFTKIEVIGIKGYFSYSHIFNFKRCYYDISFCDAFCSVVSNGYAFDDSSGIAKYNRAIGNWNDGFNSSLTTGTILPMLYKTIMLYCEGSYQVVGDGGSNHGGADWVALFWKAIKNGKDGIVAAYGNLYGAHLILIDNAQSGVQASSAPVGVSQLVELSNVYSEGNLFNYQVNRLTTGAITRMVLRDCVSRNAGDTGLFLFASGTVTLADIFLESNNTRGSGDADQTRTTVGYEANLTILNDSLYT